MGTTGRPSSHILMASRLPEVVERGINPRMVGHFYPASSYPQVAFPHLCAERLAVDPKGLCRRSPIARVIAKLSLPSIPYTFIPQDLRFLPKEALPRRIPSM
jgi:hypothetical protein